MQMQVIEFLRKKKITGPVSGPELHNLLNEYAEIKSKKIKSVLWLFYSGTTVQDHANALEKSEKIFNT